MRHAMFEVWQDGMMVVSVSGPRDIAERDARHYVMVYEQDGPAELFEIVRGKKVAVQGAGNG